MRAAAAGAGPRSPSPPGAAAAGAGLGGAVGGRVAGPFGWHVGHPECISTASKVWADFLIPLPFIPQLPVLTF